MNHREQVLSFLQNNASKKFSNSEIRSHIRLKHHQEAFQITQSLMKEGCIQGEHFGKEWFFWNKSGGVAKSITKQSEKKDISEENDNFSSADGSEDSVKRHIRDWLSEDGWRVEVKWGKERGIDIFACKNDICWIIEAKGIGKYQPMRVNYFLGALAELMQRMSNPHALYSVAFPDISQYRRLWDRLPSLAKERTGVSALFVSDTGKITRA
jgi:hypothetical protein